MSGKKKVLRFKGRKIAPTPVTEEEFVAAVAAVHDKNLQDKRAHKEKERQWFMGLFGIDPYTITGLKAGMDDEGVYIQFQSDDQEGDI